MAQITVLAPGKTAANSTDIIVVADATAIVGIFADTGQQIDGGVRCTLMQKTPGGDNAVVTLDKSLPTIQVNGPNTFYVARNASNTDVGVFYE